jgi:hypothetical protein
MGQLFVSDTDRTDANGEGISRTTVPFASPTDPLNPS